MEPLRRLLSEAPRAFPIAAIRLYQLTLSPFFGQSCRFQPTCSDYGRDALIQHGPVRGGWLAARRFCKCHPWGGSGYDPVPPTEVNR